MYKRQVHNDGAAFSILQGKQLFFTIISVIAIGILIFFLLKTPKEKKWWRLAFACFMAGTIGNFIDRLRLGYVEDFLDIHILPVFNLADMLLVGSVIGLCFLIFLDEWQKDKKSAAKGGKPAKRGNRS